MVLLVRPTQRIVDIGVGKAACGFDSGFEGEQNAMLEEQDVVAEHVRAQRREDEFPLLRRVRLKWIGLEWVRLLRVHAFIVPDRSAPPPAVPIRV